MCCAPFERCCIESAKNTGQLVTMANENLSNAFFFCRVYGNHSIASSRKRKGGGNSARNEHRAKTNGTTCSLRDCRQSGVSECMLRPESDCDDPSPLDESTHGNNA